MFPCCHQSHYRPTLWHSWPPGPASVSPSTGHFVSHPGVTPGPITGASPQWSPVVTTHTRCEAMQYADTRHMSHPGPPRVCPRCLHTVNIITNMGPVSGTSVSQTSGHVTHCHTQGAWDGGQARGVTLEPGTKTMAAWCRECELCSQMIAAAPNSHLWQSGPLSEWGRE